MTITYTSSDLAEIEATIPGHAASKNLQIVSSVEIRKETDVEVDSTEVGIEAALELAVLVGAPFISVSPAPYSAEMTRIYFESEHNDELPLAADRILNASNKHDGTLMSLTVNWVAQGLAYEWCARCKWTADLMQEVNSLLEHAEAESEAEQEDRLQQHYSIIQAAVKVLTESAKFRGEPVSRRRHIASAIITEAGLKEVDEVTLTHRIIPYANKIVNAKAYEFEQDFRDRKAELAGELRFYAGWLRETTKARRKIAATEFLTAKADGYRLMNSDFAEEVSEAASMPGNIRRF